MSKSRSVIVALCCSAMVAGVSAASAQEKKKKVTRAEAWSLCTAEVSTLPGDQHSQRYARGAACMKKYGFKI